MYRHYIGNDKYYWFKTFKVYWAYRFFIAKSIDEHTKLVPVVKLVAGVKTEVIEPANYQSKYV